MAMSEHTPLRVVVAEADEMSREGLCALFSPVPDVEIAGQAGDLDAAVRLVRSSSPDVLLLDSSIAVAGCTTAIRTLCSTDVPTAIVVLTRRADAAVAREAIAAGASAYVLKQSAFADLVTAIRKVTRGERYIDRRFTPDALAEPAWPYRPSPRELDVLRRTALGQSNKEIAAALGIAVKTVEAHKTNAMRKLDLNDRCALMRLAIARGWLDEPWPIADPARSRCGEVGEGRDR